MENQELWSLLLAEGACRLWCRRVETPYTGTGSKYEYRLTGGPVDRITAAVVGPMHDESGPRGRLALDWAMYAEAYGYGE